VSECELVGEALVGLSRRGVHGKPYNRAMDAEPQGTVLVGVVMGSRNDYAVMQSAVEVLKEFGVAHEVRVVSAHRTPDLLFEYADSAVGRGLRVIVAGAGGAAHLPGMIAAKTVVPVLGVPIPATALQGMDSLLSIVQMPKGVPVGTLAIGAAGAMNAGLLAVAMLATTDAALQKKLIAWRAGRRDEVLAQVVGDDEVSA
jgi:5-(carboxyamino)imidazole ribonucleotide mutase